MRRRVYETGHTEMLTRDKKNVIARTFVVWRIGDPLAFTQAHRRRGRRRGQARRPADQRGDRHAGRARPVGARLDEPDRPAGRSDRVGAARVDGAAGAARATASTIEQIRLERIALPEENVTAVFEQMRAERRQFAAKFEAEGEQRGEPDPLGGGARGRAHPREGRRGRGAHPRRVGGGGREDLRRRAPRRPGALPVHALARLARQAGHRQHVADPAHRLRAVLAAAEQGRDSETRRGRRRRSAASPRRVARVLDAAWQRMHWWVAAMARALRGVGHHGRQAGRSRGGPALGPPRRRHARAAGARPGSAVRLSAADRPGRPRAGQARVRDRRSTTLADDADAEQDDGSTRRSIR